MHLTFSYNLPEYQLKSVKAALLITHPGCVKVALAAARSAGLPTNRVITLNVASQQSSLAASSPLLSIDQLVDEGLRSKTCFKETQLAPGDNTKKIAFLSFSSGTTGRPKVGP